MACGGGGVVTCASVSGCFLVLLVFLLVLLVVGRGVCWFHCYSWFSIFLQFVFFNTCYYLVLFRCSSMLLTVLLHNTPPPLQSFTFTPYNHPSNTQVPEDRRHQEGHCCGCAVFRLSRLACWLLEGCCHIRLFFPSLIYTYSINLFIFISIQPFHSFVSSTFALHLVIQFPPSLSCTFLASFHCFSTFNFFSIHPLFFLSFIIFIFHFCFIHFWSISSSIHPFVHPSIHPSIHPTPPF